jgi:monoamine oxidase
MSLFARLSRKFGRSTLADRREFMQISLAAGMASLLSARPGFPRGLSTQPKVVVVGGGFGGLSCAYELKSAGCAVSVIEAGNRLGGRVLSFRDFVKGKNIEGGGEFIGSNHPTWVAYKEKFGLEFIDVSEEEDLESNVVIGGKALGAEEVARLFEEMEVANASLTEMAADVLPDEPWNSPNAAALDQRSIAEWLAGLSISELGKKLVEIQYSSDNAIDNRKASLLGMLTAIQGGGGEKYWTDTEVYRCVGGNAQLATRLAEGIGADLISMNDAVEMIDYSGSPVKIRLRSGKQLECDQVVLAIPPSTWKYVRMVPELDPTINPQMGIATKYLAAVDGPFWKKAELSQYAWGDEAISQSWELTDGQNQESPGYGLGAFSGGPSAERSLGFDRETRDRRYAEEFSRLLPGFSGHVVATRMMAWPRERLTMAGYSFPAPGEVTTVTSKICKGLPNLHFCGEHACLKFVGYMEGALNSGVSVARKIVGERP